MEKYKWTGKVVRTKQKGTGKWKGNEKWNNEKKKKKGKRDRKGESKILYEKETEKYGKRKWEIKSEG